MRDDLFQSGRCRIVGEVAQSHDGSLGLAHAFIDAIAAAGADAVKFQAHIADAESTPDEPWRVHFSKQDASRFDYWKRMEFTEPQWRGLAEHARERGLLFICSPFSLDAVELLQRVGVAAWKVASGEVGNRPMLARMAKTGRPIILSTGMSRLDEIESAARFVREQGLPLTVLQCTSAYPCPAEQVGLNMLSVLRERFACPVGLSDHSGTIYPGLAAAVLGASMVEVHVTLSREMFGPDVASSITSSELRTLAEGIRFLERALGNPVDKDALAAELQPLRAIFQKSLVYACDLPAGTRLESAHVAEKKPGTGLAPERLGQLLGRRLRRDVARNERLAEEHLEA